MIFVLYCWDMHIWFSVVLICVITLNYFFFNATFGGKSNVIYQSSIHIGSIPYELEAIFKLLSSAFWKFLIHSGHTTQFDTLLIWKILENFFKKYFWPSIFFSISKKKTKKSFKDNFICIYRVIQSKLANLNKKRNNLEKKIQNLWQSL